MKQIVDNINEILGNPEKRFFSSGFKKVRHHLGQVVIDPVSQRISAVGEIHYPDEWSTKEESELQPHLSTLDGALLSMHLCSAYLKSTYMLTEYQLSHIWIRKFVLKSGAAAQLNLENIPIISNLIKMEKFEDTLCGYISTFSCEIGNMKVEITFDHFINSTDNTVKQFDSLQEIMGDMNCTFYGEFYRNIAYELTNVNVDKEDFSLTSQITITYPNLEKSYCGVGSIYLPHYTWLDTFVCASQQVQALFYSIDNINRDKSNNLWMREIKYEYKEPVYKPQGFVQSAKVQKAKILKMGDQRWRTAVIECKNSISSSFHLVVNIAHELPAHASE